MHRADSRAFLCDRYAWRTSSVDMEVGNCNESSTMLYVWPALEEAEFPRNGP